MLTRLVAAFLCTFAYAVVRYVGFGHVALAHVPAYVLNKAICVTAVEALLMASVASARAKADEARFWASAGTQLIFVHVLLSLGLLSSKGYYPALFEGARMSLTGELVLLLGAVAVHAFWRRRAGETSSTTGRAWTLLAYSAIAGHVFAIGYENTLQVQRWNGGLPPMSLLGFLMVVSGLAVLVVRDRRAAAARLAGSVVVAVLLAGGASASAHDLPMGGSRWCFGPGRLVANLDLPLALLEQIKGVKEWHGGPSALSDSELQELSARILSPYVADRLAVTVDGRRIPLEVDRLTSNGNVYTLWLSAESVRWTDSDPVAIEYRLLFEETGGAHVNLAYAYFSDATGEGLKRLFDYSAPAAQHTFDDATRIWKVVLPAAVARGGPQGATRGPEVASSAVPSPDPRRTRKPARTGAATATPPGGAQRPAPVPIRDSGAPAPAARSSMPAPSASAPTAAAAAPAPSPAASAPGWTASARNVLRFVLLGIEHILSGYDHIAFLIALVVVAPSLRAVLPIVTAFTAAHSITLLLAALRIVRLDPRLVESAIALSICYVAAENLFRKRAAHRWLVTFCFGLVHGFGFASVLQELIVGKADLVVSVVSFNAGVELGQLMILAVMLPVLRLLGVAFDARKTAVAASIAIGVLGCTWVIERGLSVRILPVS